VNLAEINTLDDVNVEGGSRLHWNIGKCLHNDRMSQGRSS